MNWLGGIEIVAGIGSLALAVFLVGFFRFVPLLGDVSTAPGQMRLTVIPIGILLIVVFGFSLIFQGFGLI